MDSMVSTPHLVLIIHPKKEFQQGHTGLTLIEHGYFVPLAFGIAQDTAIFMWKFPECIPLKSSPKKRLWRSIIKLSLCSSIFPIFSMIFIKSRHTWTLPVLMRSNAHLEISPASLSPPSLQPRSEAFVRWAYMSSWTKHPNMRKITMICEAVKPEDPPKKTVRFW